MLGSLKKPSSPTATRWLESMDLMNAEISPAHFVIVCVVQVPVLVLTFDKQSASRQDVSVCVAHPVLPLHLGSLASSQAIIVGSFR